MQQENEGPTREKEGDLVKQLQHLPVLQGLPTLRQGNTTPVEFAEIETREVIQTDPAYYLRFKGYVVGRDQETTRLYIGGPLVMVSVETGKQELPEVDHLFVEELVSYKTIETFD